MFFEKFTKMKLADETQITPCCSWLPFTNLKVVSYVEDDRLADTKFFARSNGSALYSNIYTQHSILAEYRFLALSRAVGISIYSCWFRDESICNFSEKNFVRDEVDWEYRLKQEEKVKVGDMVVINSNPIVPYVKACDVRNILRKSLKYYMIIEKDGIKATCLAKEHGESNETIIHIPWTLYRDESHYQ